MAKVAKNVLTRGLSGKVGNLVVFRNKGDETLLTSAPGKRTRPMTESQLEHIQMFREAVIYAKSVNADPARRAEYQPGTKNGLSVYNLAVADFMKLPIITEMDISEYTGQSGQKIQVRATDNFRVTEIRVAILKADGTAVESGIASAHENGLDWIYTATLANSSLTGGRIVATARDHPGHEVQMSQMI